MLGITLEIRTVFIPGIFARVGFAQNWGFFPAGGGLMRDFLQPKFQGKTGFFSPYRRYITEIGGKPKCPPICGLFRAVLVWVDSKFYLPRQDFIWQHRVAR